MFQGEKRSTPSVVALYTSLQLAQLTYKDKRQQMPCGDTVTEPAASLPVLLLCPLALASSLTIQWSR